MERTWHFESTPVREGGALMLFQRVHRPAPLWGARQESGLPQTGNELPYYTGDVASAFYAMQRTVGNRFVRQAVEAAIARGQATKAVLRTEPHDEPFGLRSKRVCGGVCSMCKLRENTGGSKHAQTALQRKTQGKPLEPTVKSDMEARFGEDFSNVRIHTDGQARQMTRQLDADAYTVGRDIFFDAGKYDPTTYQGRRLLSHELTHVVQQGCGLRSTQASVTIGQPGDRYEREAGRISERVARPLAPMSVLGQAQRDKGRWLVEVRERWRSPDALLSRAVPAATPGKGPSLMQAAGLTMTQVACIKRVFEKAILQPKSDKWKRCYVTAMVASCNLPALQNMAAVKAALNEAITPAAWELYLADPKGLICRAPGQTPEVCCEEAPPPKEKPKEAGSTASKR